MTWGLFWLNFYGLRVPSAWKILECFPSSRLIKLKNHQHWRLLLSIKTCYLGISSSLPEDSSMFQEFVNSKRTSNFSFFLLERVFLKKERGGFHPDKCTDIHSLLQKDRRDLYLEYLHNLFIHCNSTFAFPFSFQTHFGSFQLHFSRLFGDETEGWKLEVLQKIEAVNLGGKTSFNLKKKEN